MITLENFKDIDTLKYSKENNQVTIMGEIASGFTFNHEILGESFHMLNILVKRLSGSVDKIPVMISEKLIDVTQNYIGHYVQINGQFRSRNESEGGKKKLILYVFAYDVSFVTEETDTTTDNQIFLDGYVCKNPIYRKTPLGREITDIIVATNRLNGKSDYIPCVCWGRNAKFSSGFEIGSHVRILGRVQSRDYMKQLNSGVAEKRIAYEVSVGQLSLWQTGVLPQKEIQ